MLQQRSYLILLILIILGTFIVLSPSLNTIFPFERHAKLNSFLSEVKKTNELNPKEYWEFREFYTPGTFTFSKNYTITNSQVSPLILPEYSAIGKRTNEKPYLVFHSSNVDSIDAVITSTIDLSKLYSKNAKVVMSYPSLVLTNEGTYYKLIAILPGKDIRVADGFFEDNKQDSFLANNYWLTISIIKKN